MQQSPDIAAPRRGFTTRSSTSSRRRWRSSTPGRLGSTLRVPCRLAQYSLCLPRWEPLGFLFVFFKFAVSNLPKPPVRLATSICNVFATCGLCSSSSWPPCPVSLLTSLHATRCFWPSVEREYVQLPLYLSFPDSARPQDDGASLRRCRVFKPTSLPIRAVVKSQQPSKGTTWP